QSAGGDSLLRLRARRDRRLARTRRDRAGNRTQRRDPAMPPARPIVAELAVARARGHRHYRSRLSVNQQVIQSVLQRPRSLTMLHILHQIAKTGIKTETAPSPADEMVVVARL